MCRTTRRKPINNKPIQLVWCNKFRQILKESKDGEEVIVDYLNYCNKQEKQHQQRTTQQLKDLEQELKQLRTKVSKDTKW